MKDDVQSSVLFVKEISENTMILRKFSKARHSNEKNGAIRRLFLEKGRIKMSKL